MTLQMVTANRLSDGAVVYLTADGDWSEWCADGAIADDKPAAASLLATAERDVTACRVVGPYLIDVAIENGTARPQRYREHIRAAGPSIRLDLGKQAQRR